jgi:hypothetical protein
MPAASIRTLLTAREGVSRKLLAAAADPSSDAGLLKDLSERLKHIDVAVEEHRRHAQRRALAGAVLALCIALTLLASMKVGTAEVDGTVHASAIELHLAADTELPDLMLAAPVGVFGARSVRLGEKTLADDGADAVDALRITETNVRLQRLRLPAGSLLRIEASAGAISFSVSHPSQPLRVQLSTGGAGRLSFQSLAGAPVPPARELGDVELIEAATGPHGSPAVPLRVTARSADAALVSLLKGVDRIRFARAAAGIDARHERESSVLGGVVRVGPKLKESTLDTGDQLSLGALELTQMRIGLCGGGQPTAAAAAAGCDTVWVRFAGTASEVAVASASAPRSLKPSWLEFLKDDSLAGLLWAAAVFLWGTAWSIWKGVQR